MKVLANENAERIYAHNVSLPTMGTSKIILSNTFPVGLSSANYGSEIAFSHFIGTNWKELAHIRIMYDLFKCNISRYNK